MGNLANHLGDYLTWQTLENTQILRENIQR